MCVEVECVWVVADPTNEAPKVVDFLGGVVVSCGTVDSSDAVVVET